MGKTLLFRRIVIMPAARYPGQGLSTDELLFALDKSLERKLAWYANSLNCPDPLANPATVHIRLSTLRRWNPYI